MDYKVLYVYDNPSSAGPYKGSMVVNEFYKRGDSIAAPFGMATVKSCRIIAVLEKLTRGDIVDKLVENYKNSGQESTIDLFDKFIKQYKISQHTIKVVITEFRKAIS